MPDKKRNFGGESPENETKESDGGDSNNVKPVDDESNAKTEKKSLRFSFDGEKNSATKDKLIALRKAFSRDRIKNDLLTEQCLKEGTTSAGSGKRTSLVEEYTRIKR